MRYLLVGEGWIRYLEFAIERVVSTEDAIPQEVDDCVDVEDTLETLKSEYSIVMVTHSMEQSQRIADTVIFLYLGELIEKADIGTFFENPNHERTDRFVAGETIVDAR